MSATSEPTRSAESQTGAAAIEAFDVVRVQVPKRTFTSELRAIKIVWRRELIRFVKDRMRIVTSLVQPFLFLFVLGGGLQRLVSSGTHGVDLKTFLYPGILCMTVMFTAMFSAASIVWDREFGFLREMMVAPVRRSSIVIGKCLGGATVAAFQGVIVLCLAGCPHGGSEFSDGKKAEAVQDYDTALAHYQKALQADPTNAEYKMKTMRLRFETGQHHVEAGEKLRDGGDLQMALAEFQT
ncbi:MAG: ABC transporter permease, partial [Solirubrobacteraceae bacterium]